MNYPRLQTPLAERAIGAAAAAVFLAGIVSAGLVESDSGPGGPSLAAPASAAAPANRAVSPVGQLTLPPVYSPTGGLRTGTSGGTTSKAGTGTNTARGGSGATLDRSVGLTPLSPSRMDSGSTSPSPPPTDPPATAQDPTPSLGVAVGPVAVGASPAGAGADVAGTTAGDQTSVPTSSDGVTVDLQTGVTDPITVSFP